MNAIEVHSLTKVYRPPLFSSSAPVAALRGVTLLVERGTLYSLLGPNGSGKTTLLRILAGLVTPTAGVARVAGVSIQDRKNIVEKIGFCDTDHLGFPGFMTGRENLELFSVLQNMDSRQARERISELMQHFDLEPFMDRKVKTCSRGVLQRFSLVRALLHDPEVLLLDEPVSHLDPLAAGEFHAFLRRLLERHPEKAILLTTHQLGEAEEIADKIGFIFEGSLVWEEAGSVFRQSERDLLSLYKETVNRAE